MHGSRNFAIPNTQEDVMKPGPGLTLYDPFTIAGVRK